MELLAALLVFVTAWGCCRGLVGPNVCSESQNYTITSRVKYQQPVNVRTYSWCLSIPPKCSSVHTEMREKWKVQTEYRSRLLQFCCAGFEESEERCIPKCPAGLTGSDCDEDCPEDKWGPSCFLDCRCPMNSECDNKNGKCICDDDWMGANCDISKDSYTRRPSNTKATKPLFDWSTPIVHQPTRPKVVVPNLSVISLQTSSTTAAATTSTTTTIRTSTAGTTTTTSTTSTTSTTRAPPKEVTTLQPTTESVETSSGTESTPTTTRAEEFTTIRLIPTTIRPVATAPTTVRVNATTTKINISSTTPTTTTTTTTSTTKASTTVKSTTHPSTPNVTTVFVPKVEVTSQIESPVTTSRPVETTVKDSRIIVIQPKVTKTITKDAKQVSKATESSIISLTVRKSTDVTGRKPVKLAKPGLLNITIEASTKVSKAKPTAPTYHGTNTTVTTEEVKHVLTEPEQITSVAGEEDGEEIRDEFFSALSVAMGIAVALILVATVIVLVARCRRVAAIDAKMMEMDQMQAMMNGGEDELPSSYLRSVYHSPLPDYPMGSSFLRDDKSRYPVPFMQPVVIHAVSPIMLENFRDILESHYDHPKAPRPTSMSPNTQRRCATFGTTFCPVDQCLPVTEEAMEALRQQAPNVTQDAEPVYDEIPWPPAPGEEELMQMKDEAVTEL